jgi:hypothetical protein
MKTISRLHIGTLVSLQLIVSAPAFAEHSAPSAEPQKQSEAAESVKPRVDKESTDKAVEKRKEILEEAAVALDETENALKALDDEKPDEALSALEKATGKLELILVRDPNLALAPVAVDVVTFDLLSSVETVETAIEEAEDLLEDGEVQKARPLVRNLASEIQFQTTSIPLATYPGAIKGVTPLIDEGKLDEARDALQAALNTLVVTTEVIPLPGLRAEVLLENAETLVVTEGRTDEQNETLVNLLAEARNQLKMAELLGYGTKESYKPLYEELDEIETKIAGGKGGTGWFDKIKQQLSELI